MRSPARRGDDARDQTAARKGVGDHLLTPQNAAMFVIDYQPSQFAGVPSIDLIDIVLTVRLLRA